MYLEILENTVMLLKKYELLSDDYQFNKDDGIEELGELLIELLPDSSFDYPTDIGAFSQLDDKNEVDEFIRSHLDILKELSDITQGDLQITDISGKKSGIISKYLKVSFKALGKKYSYKYEADECHLFFNDIRGLAGEWNKKLKKNFIVYEYWDNICYYYLPKEFINELKKLGHVDEHGNIENIYDEE